MEKEVGYLEHIQDCIEYGLLNLWLCSIFISSHRCDQINMTNAATVFTMLDTFLPNTVVIAARQSHASDKMDTDSSFQRNTTANNVTTLDLTAESSLKMELSVDSTHFSPAATADPVIFDKKNK